MPMERRPKGESVSGPIERIARIGASVIESDMFYLYISSSSSSTQRQAGTAESYSLDKYKVCPRPDAKKRPTLNRRRTNDT